MFNKSDQNYRPSERARKRYRPQEEEDKEAERGHHNNGRGFKINGTTQEYKKWQEKIRAFTDEDIKNLVNVVVNQQPDFSRIGTEDVLMFLKYMHALFAIHELDLTQQTKRVQMIYGSLDEMERRREVFNSILFAAQNTFLFDRPDELSAEDHKDVNDIIREINFGIYSSQRLVCAARLIQAAQSPSMLQTLEKFDPLSKFLPADQGKPMKPRQYFLYFLFHKALEKGYRIDKDKGTLFQPYYLDGQFTYSYKKLGDVETFVRESVFPICQHDVFHRFMMDGGGASYFIDQIKTIKNEYIPYLVRNRHLHAFTDGVYHSKSNIFYRFERKDGYHHVDELPTKDCIALKFHDIPFREEQMEEEMVANPKRLRNFMGIQMPNTSQILLSQEFKASEQVYIYGFIGRLLYEVKEMDNWGCVMFSLGIGGTGKSSLLRLAATFWHSEDIGMFGNIGQEMFPLEHIYDRLVYFGLDVDNHFSLDQATFQSMTVGEEVTINRKFQKPETIIWKIPGTFAGNKMPGKWKDQGGNLYRRLLIIEFLRYIENTDPQLFDRCLLERNKFLKVIVESYHYLVAKFGHESIDAQLPDKFKDSKRKALRELNSLNCFVDEQCDFEPEKHDESKKTYFVSFGTFKKEFAKFCKENNHPPSNFEYGVYSQIFAKYQITIIEPRKGTGPFYSNQRLLKGIRMKPDTGDMMSAGPNQPAPAPTHAPSRQ